MTFLPKVFDAYSLRAQLFAGVVAIAPALAALVLFISWRSFGVPHVVGALATVVLLFAIADFARSRGREVERRLYAQRGGKPSITLFRRSDSTINEPTKERYRQYLAQQLGVTPPIAESEQADPSGADAFYEQCGVWLRERTRNRKKFALLFNENVTYGFRRNVLGVRWWGVAINAAVVLACVVLLIKSTLHLESAAAPEIAVLAIAAVHAVYLLFVVSDDRVWDAARTYARQLILSCESFLAPEVAKAKPARRTKRT